MKILMANGRQRERRSVIRVKLARLSEQIERMQQSEVFPGHNLGARSEIQVIRGNVSGRSSNRPAHFRRLQRRLDHPSDARRDVVLKLEHSLQRAIEMVGPEMSAADRVDQLAGDAHALCSLADRTLQHIAHTKFTTDLLHVYGTTLIYEARVACDHKEPAN